MNTPTWFYSDGQQTYGPVNRDQLITMIQNGQLVSAHFVMAEGASEWTAIGSSPFAGYLPQAAPVQMPAVPRAAPPQRVTPTPLPPAKKSSPGWIVAVALLAACAAGYVWNQRPSAPIAAETTTTSISSASLDLGPAGLILFPHVQFSGASLEEAAEFFQVKSRDLDPDPQHKGLALLLQHTSGITPRSISIDLVNITLSEALRFVAMQARVEITRVGDAVMLKPSAAVHPPYPASQPTARVQRHNAILFPMVNFSKASLAEAVEFLRVKMGDLDPQHERAHLIIDPDLDSTAGQISLDVKDVPFSEALKYVCALAKVEAVCVGDAHYIQPKK